MAFLSPMESGLWISQSFDVGSVFDLIIYLRQPCAYQISPRSGFVIKTKLVGAGMKVFLNVCQHERIGEAGMMKKLDKDGNEVRGMDPSATAVNTMFYAQGLTPRMYYKCEWC